jgi:hypothetical protein
MDPIVLAKELAPYLAPVLPYLIKWVKATGQESAKVLGEEISKKVPEAVIKLWKKLWDKGKQDPISQVVLENAAEKPNDQSAQSALESQLSSMLADDTFRSEIANLLKDAKAEMSTLRIEMNIDDLMGTAIGLEASDLRDSGITETEIKQNVKTVKEGGVLKGVVLKKEEKNK